MASRQGNHIDTVAQEGNIWLTAIYYLSVLLCQCVCLDGKPYITFLCYCVNVFRQGNHIDTVAQEGNIWLTVKANTLTQ
jgi:hypothetical protein